MDAAEGGDVFLVEFAQGAADGFYLAAGELGGGAMLAADGATATGEGVPVVLGVCAGVQVGRVAAGGVVAVMADDFAFGDVSIGELVGNPAGGDGFAPGDVEFAVAVTVTKAEPGPAGIGAAGAVDFRPEAFGDGLGLA